MWPFDRILLGKSRRKRDMEKRGLIGSRKRQTEERTIGHAVERSQMVFVILIAMIWLASVGILMLPHSKTGFVALVPNQTAPYSVYADFDFTYENRPATEEKIAEAAAQAPLILAVEEDSRVAGVSKLNLALRLLGERLAAEADEELTFTPAPEDALAGMVASLPKESLAPLGFLVSDAAQREALVERADLALARGVIGEAVKNQRPFGQQVRIRDQQGRLLQERPLSEIPVPREAAETLAETTAKGYSRVQDRKILRQSLLELLGACLPPTLVVDERLSGEVRQAAAAQVQPTVEEIKRGEVMLRKGQVVKTSDIELLEIYTRELEMRHGREVYWEKLAHNMLVSLLMMIAMGVYIFHIHPEVAKSNHKMCIVATVIGLSMASNYAMIEAFNHVAPNVNVQPSFITMVLPLGLPALLLSVLIGLRTGFYVGLFVAAICALQLDSSYRLVVDGMVISCLVGYAVRRANSYKYYCLAGGGAVALATAAVNYKLFWGAEDIWRSLWLVVSLSAVNAMLTGFLSLILLFLMETLFQVSTKMSLLSLCDYNHPLLKRLQLEAPGTYHHSLMVSTMVEQAAREIEADPIKARVCALFHDIGKLSQPEYFIENSMGERNKHSDLSPRMSSLVILNHVKEGVDIAIKYKLRKIIRDAIQQHHGTDLVSYFYKLAQEDPRGKSGVVEEQEFRYQGPLPREKEVVILSLADACEAAARSLQKPTPAKIEALVWEILRKRVRDRQLDNADMTFGELSKIRQSFVKSLSTMLLLTRVAYPKDEEDEEDDNDLFKAAQHATNSPKNGGQASA